MSRFRSTVLAGVAAVGFACLATPASAITMQATYTGTVYNSYASGLFGGTGGTLNGQAFSLSYIYDPATPGAGHFSGTDTVVVYGDTLSATPTPMLSANLTINGHTETVHGEYFTRVYNYSHDDPDPANDLGQVHREALDYQEDATSYFRNRLYAHADTSDPLAVPLDLEVPFILASLISSGIGSFHFTSYNKVDSGGTSDVRTAFGSFAFTGLTVSRVSDVSEVPLPAALPLLIGGLAGLGFLKRRGGAR